MKFVKGRTDLGCIVAAGVLVYILLFIIRIPYCSCTLAQTIISWIIGPARDDRSSSQKKKKSKCLKNKEEKLKRIVSDEHNLVDPETERSPSKHVIGTKDLRASSSKYRYTSSQKEFPPKAAVCPHIAGAVDTLERRQRSKPNPTKAERPAQHPPQVVSATNHSEPTSGKKRHKQVKDSEPLALEGANPNPHRQKHPNNQVIQTQRPSTFKKLCHIKSAGKKISNITSKHSPSVSSQPPKPETVQPVSSPRVHCSYCDRTYSELSHFQQHLLSQIHKSKVNSDLEKTWKYRSPPWNCNTQWKECRNRYKGMCMFGDNCIQAHSEDELQEWKERHRYRMMKINKDKQQKLFAFMDKIMTNYNSPRDNDCIAEELPGIQVKCSQDRIQYLSPRGKDSMDSTYSYTWKLIVKTTENRRIRRVCLLYDEHRSHFKLSQPNEPDAQLCPGNLIIRDDGMTYDIDVIFTSQILGSFSQWVLFGVGSKPYLVHKLQVNVGSVIKNAQFDLMQKEKVKVQLLDCSNLEIVKFSEDELTTIEKELMVKYEKPLSSSFDGLDDLTRDNYKEYMHSMLYMEEHECNQKISKFATESKMTCLESIVIETLDSTIANFAQDGTMFGHVDLKAALVDDSETSQIITRTVQKMLVKFSTSSTKVYEAQILHIQDELGKTDQDTVYVKLSPTCVTEERLQTGTDYTVQIQLQTNRLSFCYMHSAVDNLHNMDMVFPPKDQAQIFPSPATHDSSSDLQQHRAELFIQEHGGIGARRPMTGVGPVLVYGPFGTGKTHTLATAVKNTIESRPQCKILICTHSNSAADLYITEHFDGFVTDRVDVKLIRIYATIRNIKTISETVQKYTPIQDGAIRDPRTEEIKESSIVITTLTTSKTLVPGEFSGHFSHILIDEAGQALETETLQPLTLATADTCVVLAGDHIQMSPKVFSTRARHAKFNMSILERLFYRKVGRILLHSNYRTNQNILDFISKAFYSGNSSKRTLKAKVNPPSYPGFNHPLLFCTVKGQDQKTGASYINQLEVDQLVENVKYLHDRWPVEWGLTDERSIGIVTPYKMQVRLIRSELRKRRLQHINVETVQNVQGKQFRVLVISTVRTRSTLNKAQMTTFVSKIRPATHPDETYDYGFLSDPRLLNTALTRAQSLVMVVGDPIALCSEGECSKTWQKYLEECEAKETLYPLGTTVEGIRQEMVAAKQHLNPEAPVFQPHSSSMSKSSSVNMKDNNEPTVKKRSYQIDDFWSTEDDSSLPDGILRELYKQIVSEEFPQDSKRRVVKFRMVEENDHIVLKSTEVGAHSDEDSIYVELDPKGGRPRELAKKSKRKVLKYRKVEEKDNIELAFDYKDKSKDDDSSDEGVLKNDMHDENARQKALNQVQQFPDKFKICSFRCEKTGVNYAIPLDEDSSGRISITSKRRRGRALNMDEVIVEILEDPDDSIVSESEKKKTYGQVICILKRAPKSSVMLRTVCKLDAHVVNQMVPLDRTLPKFILLSGDKKLKKSKTGASPDFIDVPIYRRSESDVQFDRMAEVSRRDRPHKLFLVEYLKWFADAPFPFGVVTEELPQGDDKETGIRILKLLHGVKNNTFKCSIMEEVMTKFPNNWTIPEQEINSRYDARGIEVFTIDPPDAHDLDDALSVDMVDDNFQVGIHIADVSFFVSKDSLVDKEAKSRATSFYSSLEKPVNMLPPQLSNRFCSLLPGQDRLTISVFVTLDDSGSVLGDVKIVRSVIQSRNKLTYGDAEETIKRNGDVEGSHSAIQNKILTLSKLAQERRRVRLGVGRFAFSHDSEEEELLHPLAHSMVEEMMLLANEKVARFLAETCPEIAPLRRQLPPSDEEVTGWFGKHGKDVPNSVDLLSRPLSLDRQTEVPNDMHVMTEKWKQLRDLVKGEEKPPMSKLIDLICSDENHPQLAVAKANFFIIQENSDYIRSGEHPEDKRVHHSLGMRTYTHFSSPIRRYFDLVVHRILITSLNNKNAVQGVIPEEPPYATEELEFICQHCNNQTVNSNRFEKDTLALNLALKLREDPQSFQVFVRDISDTSLDLVFPYRRFVPSTVGRVALKLLKPKSKPEINEDKTKLELNWTERIFEKHGSIGIQRPIPTVAYSLDKEKMIVKVPQLQWQQILSGIQEDKPECIQHAVMVAESEQQLQQEERRHGRGHHNLPVEEITCESSDPNNPALSVNFTRTFERGDVIKVQLHASIQRGILTPNIQLFGLTPKLSFCTEHRVNAIDCFAEVAKHRANTLTESIEQYQNVWLPILKMSAAYNAVVEGGSSVIHYVNVTWKHIQLEQESYIYRWMFVVKNNFLLDRNLKIHRGDYLCIRYSNLPLSPETHKERLYDLKKRLPSETKQSSKVDLGKATFVFHAVVSEVKDIAPWTDDWTLVVQAEMNQHSSPFPDVLLGNKKIPTCTIELIPKSESDGRLESAINNLGEASPLLHEICLHETTRKERHDPVLVRLLETGKKVKSFAIRGSPFPSPNESQKAALSLALQQEFTIIQGPPGTGKTVTGAHLTYFFTEVNKKLLDSGQPPQVLYCGPSNKSVDVVAHYLLRLGLPVIRVYNHRIEEHDYPVPELFGKTKSGTASPEAKTDPGLVSISLHHLIRRKSNKYSAEILDFDKKFQHPGYRRNYDDYANYRKIIQAANAAELPKYKVVLCTCNEAGSRRIKSLKVIQCIIDEAGMCTEPETLIPLVGSNPCQVVLIGDHKQLRPIILERTAVELGMGISLLEKYEDKAHMLTIQYRMHESICAFPSQEFYNGRLETADSVKVRRQSLNIWPGGRDNPMVFCHHIGVENTLSVRTDDGGEQSKANPQEVLHVVRMASVLVRRVDVNPSNLVILTQYRLQKSQIEEGLISIGLGDIKVSTVITSQGNEWDYVILSTVRSLPRVEIDDKPSVAWKRRNLGFITDENQTNVAITRPKLGLIIVGNKFLLQTHRTWKSLIRHYDAKNALVEAKHFL